MRGMIFRSIRLVSEVGDKRAKAFFLRDVGYNDQGGLFVVVV